MIFQPIDQTLVEVEDAVVVDIIAVAIGIVECVRAIQWIDPTIVSRPRALVTSLPAVWQAVAV
ncbi:MAG: hypothetical protein CXX73_02525 [Methanobacteriota archaeon]|nr:MAG: hypothetical protein CXX73_02525 [Euryarchaeota archaeon]